MSDETVGAARPIPRRTALRTLVGLGLVAGTADCAPGASAGGPAAPAPTDALPAPPTRGAETPVGAAAPERARPAEAAAAHGHPASGDMLVHALGDGEGRVITPADVPLGGPQVLAYPMDAAGGHVARESRLDQVILVRLDPADLTEQTRARAVDGVVAYSAICTHTGCEVTDWDERARHLVCPCHDSEFDPADAARVVFGPAPRRLAALPLEAHDGGLRVAGPFVGRVGFQRGSPDATGPRRPR